MSGRPPLRRALLVWAALTALAAPWAAAQESAADLSEDIRGLNQRVGELSLRVEQLEHENTALKSRIEAMDRNRDAVTGAQLNGAVADLNASIKSAVDASRQEILQRVASQMESLAKQTNSALDALAKQAAARGVPADVSARPPPGDARNRAGVSSYTVQKGDTLGVIAKKMGVREQDLIDANKLADPSKIMVGQVLLVPGGK